MVSPEAADYEEGEEEEENVGDKTAGKEEENVGDNTEEDNQRHHRFASCVILHQTYH